MMELREKFETLERIVDITKNRKSNSSNIVFIGDRSVPLEKRDLCDEHKYDIKKMLQGKVPSAFLLDILYEDNLEVKKLRSSCEDSVALIEKLLPVFNMNDISIQCLINIGEKVVVDIQGESNIGCRKLIELKKSCIKVLKQMEMPKIKGLNKEWEKFTLRVHSANVPQPLSEKSKDLLPKLPIQEEA